MTYVDVKILAALTGFTIGLFVGPILFIVCF